MSARSARDFPTYVNSNHGIEHKNTTARETHSTLPLCTMKRMHVGQFDARARSLPNVAHKTPLTCSPFCLPQHHQLRERAPMAINTTVRDQETSDAKFAGRRHDIKENIHAGSIAQATRSSIGLVQSKSQPPIHEAPLRKPRTHPSGTNAASPFALHGAPLRQPDTHSLEISWDRRFWWVLLEKNECPLWHLY